MGILLVYCTVLFNEQWARTRNVAKALTRCIAQLCLSARHYELYSNLEPTDANNRKTMMGGYCGMSWLTWQAYRYRLAVVSRAAVSPGLSPATHFSDKLYIKGYREIRSGSELFAASSSGSCFRRIRIRP
jgi:hypothetical protein